MKVYIGNKELNDDTYKTIKDPSILKYVADDSECSVIVFDSILKKYNIDTVAGFIELAVQKLRLGGVLKIIDVDFDLLLHVYKKAGNILDLNRAMFEDSEIRSYLNYELIIDMLAKYPRITVSNMNLKNIEFDIEAIRK